MTPEQFQQCREEMGLSRKQLAALLGYSHADAAQDYNTIKRYENGSRSISPICSRLMTMIYRHWLATGNLPEFT